MHIQPPIAHHTHPDMLPQAMWGSVNMCSTVNPLQVTMDHIVDLAKMGKYCHVTDALPLRCGEDVVQLSCNIIPGVQIVKALDYQGVL